MGAIQEAIMLVVTPISFALGLGISIVPLKLIPNKDYGEFRLVLIKTSTETHRVDAA